MRGEKKSSSFCTSFLIVRDENTAWDSSAGRAHDCSANSHLGAAAGNTAFLTAPQPPPPVRKQPPYLAGCPRAAAMAIFIGLVFLSARANNSPSGARGRSRSANQPGDTGVPLRLPHFPRALSGPQATPADRP